MRLQKSDYTAGGLTHPETAIPVTLSYPAIYDLAERALTACGATPENAAPVADSVQSAEAEGLRIIGFGYMQHYCDHLRYGKVNGKANPQWTQLTPAAIRVDADHGFSHSAFVAAQAALVASARTCGIATMSITQSYHAGVVGWFMEKLTQERLVCLGFGNSPPAMAPWGGKQAFFGTNPMGFGVPPLIVDQSSSVISKLKVMQAGAQGRSIPDTWTLDEDGQPTTDPERGLAGSMAPFGGYKGAAIALMVDVLAGGVTDSNFSYQASMLTDNHSGPPELGQLFIAIDPEHFGAGFETRAEAMFSAMGAQEGVRLPGSRRHAHRASVERDGVEVDDALYAQLTELCA